MTSNPTPPIPEQQQNEVPGRTAPTNPKPDHGEHSYQGHGRLAGKAAVVTGGDSGVGRAVAISRGGHADDNRKRTNCASSRRNRRGFGWSEAAGRQR
jgi:hypothetical protein